MERLDRSELLRAPARWRSPPGRSPGGALLSSAGTVDPRVRALAAQLQGQVIGRGQTGYDAARLLYSTRSTASGRSPSPTARAPTDVARAIRWARAARHPHRSAERRAQLRAATRPAPGLVIDVSRVCTRSAVNAARTQATIGAGARLIDVYDRLWQKRRTIPAGSCPTVGVAGLALGGGVGFSSRAFGTTSDNVVRVRIVDAQSRVLDCDSSHHSDLYWASRGGGGGNFGIATSFTFRLHPVGTVTTFVVDWPWAQAKQAFAAWQQWAPHAPSTGCSRSSTSPPDRRSRGCAPRASSSAAGRRCNRC